MALFGKKDKKLSLDEILASIESLSEEDKNKLKAAIGGEDKTEDKDADSVDAEKTDIEKVKDDTTTGEHVDTDELEDDSAVEEIED